MTTTAVGTVRVWVPDVWEVVELPLTPETTISQLKANALATAMGARSANPANYLVKYRGALVTDEAQTLGSMQLPDRAPLIVLPARRRPVT